ncbi:ASCH domain-containing protein [Streptomyces sp. NPDC096310]|uniref:ASCH domain-containing protein n=1 Tax=Streptomyces sp. NPDC096310 TaxID=3366082 RepID=UPI0037F94D42
MRALTIRQPWADAIAHGTKRTENRTRKAPAKRIGTRILIHAGAAYDSMGRFIITDRNALNSWPDTRGAIIAVATLTSSHFAAGCCCKGWGEPNVHHWMLTDVTALPEPVPAKGALGFWKPADDVITAAITQTQAARQQ